MGKRCHFDNCAESFLPVKKEKLYFGEVTSLKICQFEYLQPIITQYFIDNKSEIWLLFLIAHSKR